ncbi:hypothetical protein VP1G_10655 [Cytospora mali]|uniref:Uncharacterized protein n=1 Tax=Cytospora mali TaxID=578113 RepID=A0A194URM2_CYTMA|nr:hypothetical protein VP1G_10655 [Valsa mali var. pyri (nom. inval.)]
MGCLYSSDKIAMLANICNWDQRLEAREIEKRGWSSSLCLWIMTIANGDGSFFCPEIRCKTNASGANQTTAWVPHAETKLGGMMCSGLLDFVSMSMHHDGLHVKGWLWQSERFIDLSDLKSLCQDIHKHAESHISNLTGAEIHHDFSFLLHAYGEEDNEENGSKMREFFWALLVKLSMLQEHECANLVWEAVKLRYAGGFYGRSLQTIPICDDS